VMVKTAVCIGLGKPPKSWLQIVNVMIGQDVGKLKQVHTIGSELMSSSRKVRSNDNE